MGYNMYLIKIKKQSVEDILKKYCETNLDDLPYEAFEELKKASGSILFEARMNVFGEIKDSLPFAHEKYVYLTKEIYELMFMHCRKKISQYQLENASKNEWEYEWYKKLICWFQSFMPNWDNEVIIYEYDY